MNRWMRAASLAGILSTAVVWGTDIFFLTVGRSALRLARISAVTEVMGFLHMFANARMPIWGTAAILSNFLLVLFGRTGQRRFHGVALLTLLMFLIVYNRWSKPINRLQTEAAKSGRNLENGRELQAAWDRSLVIRVPLLRLSMVTQCVVLLLRQS